jgi:hypothetical protein
MNEDNNDLRSKTAKPTPAQLLAQADALMKKNRATLSDDDIPLLEEEVSLADVPAAQVREDTNWDSVCENVYSRVMQQLDMYAEFGLRDRLTRELRPRLNQMFEQLAADLSMDVSEKMRRFVAQAIDEEVARMRANHKK